MEQEQEQEQELEQYFVIERHGDDLEPFERFVKVPGGQEFGTFENAHKYDDVASAFREITAQCQQKGLYIGRAIRVIPEQKGYPAQWQPVYPK